MRHKRTAKRARRLCSILALITLLLASAPPVHPLAPLGTLDNVDGVWRNQAPAAPSARFRHATTSLGGDQALLFGGYDGSWKSDTWVYDLSDNTWTNQAPVAPSARYLHAMAYIGEDQVLLFGGIDGSSVRYGDTWVYDLSDNTWTSQAPASAPSAREAHAMAYLGGDQVLLFGGNTDSGYSDETWIYDLSDNTWTPMAQALAASSEGASVPKDGAGGRAERAAPSARCYHAMAYIGGDQVLLFGGWDGNHNGETWVYDLSDNTWTNQASAATRSNPNRKEWAAPSARYAHAMAYLGGDRMLLFGGWDVSQNDETWVYDLSNNIWTNQASTGPSARYGHALASLGEDQVLLFGGAEAGGLNDETWLATGFYNQPPVAGAGPDQAVSTLALVTLDGSGSTDPEGDLPLTYLWAQTGGPVATFTPHLSVTTFTAPGDPAVLTFTLTVTDSLGFPDPTPDEVVITVTPYRVYLPLVARNR